MIQYKHANTAIFEGYAGSDPSWIQILEEEKGLASIDYLKEIYFDVEEGCVAGPKGKELERDLELIFNDLKGQASDKRKDGLQYWLSSKRKNLHIGNFNYCFFDPDTALCIAGRSEKDAPILNHCQPNICANSCIGKRHLPVWQEQVLDADNLLQSGLISGPQRIIIEKDRDDAVQIINSILLR
jgi:hypothetical protein